MTARSFPLPDHQSHVISAAGPCYLGFSSTKVSTSEAFHLKSLIKQLTKQSRKKTQDTPKYSNVFFTTTRLRSQKKKKKKRSLFIVVLLPLALQGGRASSPLRRSIHRTPVLPSSCNQTHPSTELLL